MSEELGPRFDFLDEPFLSVSSGAGLERVPLPGLLCRLARGEPIEPSAVQAHQQHAVHAFFVQLAAIALARAGRDLAGHDENTWREMLLALTDGAHEPYCLVVPDLARPAFFQPPVPEQSIAGWGSAAAADEIDVLVTAKNHDVKASRMARASPEHWLFALTSLQTMQGFSGRDNYGVARMNGGFGSRPALSSARSISFADRFARDVRVLLDARETLAADYGYAASRGLALVWLEPWDGKTSLALSTLDPCFIEVCRRVRLELSRDRIHARTSSTKVPRIDAKERKGDLGDPWTPVKRDDEHAALTLGSAGFDYAKLADLLFGGGFKPSAALKVRPEDGEEPVAIARAMVRGQGKTEGLHERVVPIPKNAHAFFLSDDGLSRIGARAKQRIEVAGNFRNKLLKMALLSLLQGGAEKLKLDDKRAEPFIEEAEQRIDAVFFPSLFADVSLDNEAAATRWERTLYEIGEAVLANAIRGAPIPVARRPRAIAAAEGRYHGIARTVLSNAFSTSSTVPSASEEQETP